MWRDIVDWVQSHADRRTQIGALTVTGALILATTATAISGQYSGPDRLRDGRSAGILSVFVVAPPEAPVGAVRDRLATLDPGFLFSRTYADSNPYSAPAWTSAPQAPAESAPLTAVGPAAPTEIMDSDSVPSEALVPPAPAEPDGSPAR